MIRSAPEKPAAENVTETCGHECACGAATPPDKTGWQRRTLLGGLAGWLFSGALFRSIPALADDVDPRKQRAQAGDYLTFRKGPRKGEVIAIEDVNIGEDPLLAYPYDPEADVIRDGSRLNQIVVLRLNADELSDEVRARATDGIIAYSAICTHQNCPVTGWHPDHEQFICPCHETHYDPKDGARVVSGPAKRALPALPLTTDGNTLVAADGLTGTVGRKKRRSM